MKVRQKFIYQEFFRFFALVFFLFGAFTLIIDFFEKFPSFLSFKKPFILFISYLFWKSWIELYQFFPFILGLSALLQMFWWSRNRELIAFLSLGFSKSEVLGEFLKIYALFSLLAGVILSFIFPRAVFNAIYIWDYQMTGKRAKYLVFKKEILFQGKDFFLVATPLEPGGEYLKNIALLFFKDLNDPSPQKVIWADKGWYENGKWLLKGVTLQEVKKGFYPKRFKTLKVELPFKPYTLVVVEKSLHFLSFKELYQRLLFLKKVKRPCRLVIAEIFLRLMYIFWPLCLVYFPLIYYFEHFKPDHFAGEFLKSFFLFFLFTIWLMFLQTFVRKGELWAGFLLLLTISWIGFRVFSLVFLEKSGKKEGKNLS